MNNSTENLSYLTLCRLLLFTYMFLLGNNAYDHRSSGTDTTFLVMSYIPVLCLLELNSMSRAYNLPLCLKGTARTVASNV